MLVHRVHILFQLTFFLFLNPYQLLNFQIDLGYSKIFLMFIIDLQRLLMP
jgi:hypothetical protein